jgi:hypothetical protein
MDLVLVAILLGVFLLVFVFAGIASIGRQRNAAWAHRIGIPVLSAYLPASALNMRVHTAHEYAIIRRGNLLLIQENLFGYSGNLLSPRPRFHFLQRRSMALLNGTVEPTAAGHALLRTYAWGVSPALALLVSLGFTLLTIREGEYAWGAVLLAVGTLSFAYIWWQCRQLSESIRQQLAAFQYDAA